MCFFRMVGQWLAMVGRRPRAPPPGDATNCIENESLSNIIFYQSFCKENKEFFLNVVLSNKE